MAFTYDPDSWGAGGPPDLQLMRKYLGDTNAGDVILSDEELQPYLDQYPTVKRAAYEAAIEVHARYAREGDADGAGIRSSRSQVVNQMADVIKNLRRQLWNTAKPRTIQTKAEKTAALSNTSYDRPNYVHKDWYR